MGIQQLKKLAAVERKSLEALLGESSDLLVAHQADLAQPLFHHCRALSGNIHRQTWFDQPLTSLMEILLEVRHCGSSPLLAVEEVVDSPDQVEAGQKALSMDVKTHRKLTVLPYVLAVDRAHQEPPLQRADGILPDAGWGRRGHLSSEHPGHLDRGPVVQVPGLDWTDLGPRWL